MRLKPSAVVAIGTALHELAIDAATHGALSVPSGRVHIDWDIAEPDTPRARLAIHWRESDGPRVDGAQPLLGREIIEVGLSEIGGSAIFEFTETGLSAGLSVPLASGAVLPSGAGDQASSPDGPDRTGIMRKVD